MPPNLPTSTSSGAVITDVWRGNLEIEFRKIAKAVQTHPYVGMDTEYPGLIHKPPYFTDLIMGSDMYKFVRSNVNALRLVQLGLTLMDNMGNLASPICTWQFNFKFDEAKDSHDKVSINFLKEEAGIDFRKHADDRIAITVNEFAEFLTGSGLVMMDKVVWITFHGVYDFAFLLRLLLNQDIPEDMDEFFEELKCYFPFVYDTKFLLENQARQGGLQELANKVNVKRVGQAHQAGSDSLLTAGTFLPMWGMFYKSDDPLIYNHMLYTLTPRVEGSVAHGHMGWW